MTRDEHRERMKERRARQRARQSGYGTFIDRFGRMNRRPLFPRTKSDDPSYRKSIWPAAKIARRARVAEQRKLEAA